MVKYVILGFLGTQVYVDTAEDEEEAEQIERSMWLEGLDTVRLDAEFLKRICKNI